MDYTQTLGLIQTPLLRDLLSIAILFAPFLVGWWNRTHTAKVANLVTSIAETSSEAATAAQGAEATALQAVEALTPNHGSSLADAVNRIEATVNDHTEQIAGITRRLNHHIVEETLSAAGQESEPDYGAIFDEVYGGVLFPQLTRVPATAYNP